MRKKAISRGCRCFVVHTSIGGTKIVSTILMLFRRNVMVLASPMLRLDLLLVPKIGRWRKSLVGILERMSLLTSFARVASKLGLQSLVVIRSMYSNQSIIMT